MKKFLDIDLEKVKELNHIHKIISSLYSEFNLSDTVIYLTKFKSWDCKRQDSYTDFERNLNKKLEGFIALMLSFKHEDKLINDCIFHLYLYPGYRPKEIGTNNISDTSIGVEESRLQLIAQLPFINNLEYKYVLGALFFHNYFNCCHWSEALDYSKGYFLDVFRSGDHRSCYWLYKIHQIASRDSSLDPKVRREYENEFRNFYNLAIKFGDPMIKVDKIYAKEYSIHEEYQQIISLISDGYCDLENRLVEFLFENPSYENERKNLDTINTSAHTLRFETPRSHAIPYNWLNQLIIKNCNHDSQSYIKRSDLRLYEHIGAMSSMSTLYKKESSKEKSITWNFECAVRGYSFAQYKHAFALSSFENEQHSLASLYFLVRSSLQGNYASSFSLYYILNEIRCMYKPNLLRNTFKRITEINLKNVFMFSELLDQKIHRSPNPQSFNPKTILSSVVNGSNIDELDNKHWLNNDIYKELFLIKNQANKIISSIQEDTRTRELAFDFFSEIECGLTNKSSFEHSSEFSKHVTLNLLEQMDFAYEQPEVSCCYISKYLVDNHVFRNYPLCFNSFNSYIINGTRNLCDIDFEIQEVIGHDFMLNEIESINTYRHLANVGVSDQLSFWIDNFENLNETWTSIPVNWRDKSIDCKINYVFYRAKRANVDTISEIIRELVEVAYEGHVYAQYILGTMYDENGYLERNKESAEFWYLKSALQGFGPSISRVQKINPKLKSYFKNDNNNQPEFDL